MTTNPSDRTLPIGLFNVAVSYDEAAKALQVANLRTTHRNDPVSNLYFHAIELFLKSYLRMHGHAVEELENKFRHNYKRMRKRASKLGLPFTDHDLQVLAYMEQTDIVIAARYIKETYYPQAPTIDAIAQTTSTIRGAVRSALKAGGVNVR